MPAPQPALRSFGAHVHPFGATCPTCDQPIPNEKAEEIRARAQATEARLIAEADARAAQTLAVERLRIEEAAELRIEQAKHEKAEGRKLAEAGLEAQIAAAEKAKVDAESLASQRV